MFSIITRIEVTPSQTLGTCPEVRPGGGQSWGRGRGPACLASLPQKARGP